MTHLPLTPVLSLLASLAIWHFSGMPLSGQTQFWTPAPWDTVAPEEQGEFSSTPQPIRLIAPRNGYASGQVVVRGGRLGRVSMSELRGPRNSTLPSSLVEIRYAAQQTPGFPVSHPHFDFLLPEPPTQTLSSDQMLPIWITLQVPAGVLPGTYEGQLSIGTTTVPVILEVADYLLPDPIDWIAWGHYIQSFESIAWTYGTRLWSEEHFARMIPSLRMLKGLGNNVIHIPVQRNTYYGNDHGMLVFREEGGQLRPDFRFVEQYLDLVKEHHGEPRVIWLYLWEVRQGTENQAADDRWVPVSILGSGSSLRDGELPLFGLGEADEIWDEVIRGMRERVRQRGWNPATVMVGALADQRERPGERTLQFIYDRDLSWVVFSHWRGDPRHADRPLNLPMRPGVARVGLAEIPDHTIPPNRPRRLGGGWPERFVAPWLTTARGAVTHNSLPSTFRLLPDASVSQHEITSIGLGRIGFDGWPAIIPGQGEEARFPILHRRRNGWFRLHRSNPSGIVGPGENGALGTVRYEMLREGSQEAEARILLERARESGALSAGLRDEIEAFFPEWIGQRYFVGGRRTFVPETTTGWFELTGRLYELAGRASREANLEAEVQVPEGAMRVFREENARSWTSQDGRAIEAEFLRYTKDGVSLLLPSNQEVMVPLPRLSEEDRDWVRKESGYRLWTSRDGSRQLEARLINREGNRVTIERIDGETFATELTNFSPDDQKYVEENF